MPPTNPSAEYNGLAWNIRDHEEYVRNKSSVYVWTITKDKEHGIIAVPYKDITNGLAFFIVTEGRRVEGYEYVKL